MLVGVSTACPAMKPGTKAMARLPCGFVHHEPSKPLAGDRSEDAAGETDLLCKECAIPTSGGLGFVGNRDDYYNAANSSLAQACTFLRRVAVLKQSC